MQIPVLTTERLTLRAVRVDDFDDCLALWTNPVVTRYIGGRVSTGDETWVRLQRYAGMWQLLGYGYWIVQETSSGDYVGDLGFGDHRRAMEPSIVGIPEVGWAFKPAYFGRGYATEAVRAALVWSDANLADARTVCIISPANLASIRVAEKCGFGDSQLATFNGDPTLLFTRHARTLAL